MEDSRAAHPQRGVREVEEAADVGRPQPGEAVAVKKNRLPLQRMIFDNLLSSRSFVLVSESTVTCDYHVVKYFMLSLSFSSLSVFYLDSIVIPGSAVTMCDRKRESRIEVPNAKLGQSVHSRAG